MALPKVSQYVKNVGKSVAFASIDVIKNNTTGIKDFMESNDEIFKSAYSSVKNYRSTLNSTNKSIRQSNLYVAVDIGIKNLIEDAKSGNFYNERDYSNEILGLDSDDDFGDDFNYNSSSTKSYDNNIDKAISSAAKSQNTMVAEGTSLIIKGNQASTKLLMANMDKMSANISSGLGAVYSGIDKTNVFLNTSVVTHMENSKKYFENSLTLAKEQNMMMKELLEMQRNLYKAQSTTRKESALDNSMNYNGSMNIPGYMKNVKANANQMLDSSGLGVLFGGMGGTGNMWMAFAASPLKLVLGSFMNMIMSTDFKKALKSFDNAMTTMFSQTVTSMNKAKDRGDGSLLSILGKLFGIDIENKKSINTSNYNKGAVPFDGLTRQSIIEVIPGYLSRIESALNNSNERHYDYKSGKWKSINNIKKDFDYVKQSTVANANYGIKSDTYELVNNVRGYDQKEADKLLKSIENLMNKLYEDGGHFDPKMGQRPGSKYFGEEPAWKYYGARSEKEFENIVKSLSRETVRGIASNNMQARQNYSNRLKDFEQNGDISRQLFNGAYDSNTNTSKSGGVGLLSLSKDSQGHNVFYYLQEILKGISNRNYKSGSNDNGNNKRSSNSSSSSSNNTEDSSESEDGPTSEDDSSNQFQWDQIEKDRNKRLKEENDNKRFGSWIRDKLDKSPVGKYFSNILGGASTILSKPLQFATNLLNTADESIFKLMFGSNDFKDDDGKRIDSVFEYMMYKIKKSFKDLSDWMHKNVFDKVKKFIDPYWQKYGKPVVDEARNTVSRGISRVKTGISNTYGSGIKYISNRLFKGDVVSADEAEARSNVENAESSASGRLVTKRGLTMISPGEIIIPASFDKSEQSKMLALEKRDKKRIVDSIGFNASGNIDTDAFKQKLKEIFDDNKHTGAKVGAGGLLGAGASLLSGINPVLGAAAGAGLSILNNSETFKRILFGNATIGEDGEIDRDGGIVSKKIYDIFKKAIPDMTDFGIAGGLLGLMMPFGPLGGAAIGAGLGYLKNSDKFQKFIFGDETEEGFIKKESYDKMKEMLKTAVPNMTIGAGLGVLSGPFGLLGNAVMGSALGFISSTDSFHKFVFGEENSNKNSLVNALKTSVIDPVKDQMAEFAVGFADYAKKYILKPMQDFWKPFKQMMKNAINNTANAIKDHINDMFEKAIGIPIADFLQEKIFKPVTKVLLGVLKVPLNIGKAVVAAPFQALGGIGNSIRMRQIQKGTAYDMSASERLGFRENHSFRNFTGNLFGRDKMYEQDQLLAGMSQEQLESLSANSASRLKTKEQIQQEAGKARSAVGNGISSFFNEKDSSGKNRYSKVNYSIVKRISKLAANGDIDKANAIINKTKLSDEEKQTLISNVQDLSKNALTANRNLAASKRSDAEIDIEMQKLIGRKFRGRKDQRQLNRSADAELRSRASNAVEESPEEQATNNLTSVYSEKADEIINTIKDSNELLKQLVPKQKQDLPDDQIDMETWMKTNAEQENAEGNPTQTTKAIQNVIAHKSGYNIDGAGQLSLGLPANEDSKDSVEAEAQRQKEKENEIEQTDAVKETNNILSNFVTEVFGTNIFKKKSKDSEGILSKIGSGLGTMFDFLGLGSSFGLTAIKLGVGVSLFGYATEWFKTSVWPSINSALFGTTNAGGTSSTGLLSGIGSSFKEVILGSDGQSGLLGGLTTWFGDKFNTIAAWWGDNGGLWGLVDKAMAKMVTGWGYAVDNVVTPLTAVLVKSLPSLFIGLAKGVLQGLKIAVWNKELPNQDSNIDFNTDSSLSELSSMSSSNSSALASSNDSFWSSIKNSFSTAKSSAAYTANNASSLRLSSIFSSTSSDSINNETSSGGPLSTIAGMLGQTSRTNELEYDENGNITTTYVQNNKSDSALSALAGAAGEGFMRSLAGESLTSGVSALSKVGTKGVGSGIVKGVTSAAGTALNATGKILDGTSSLGSSLNNIFTSKTATNAASEVAESATSTAAKVAASTVDDAAESVLKTGFTKIFTNLAEGTVGKLIRKVVSTEVTEEAMKKSFIAIGEKLAAKSSTKVLGTAASKIGTAIAGYSPLMLAILAVDFTYGYDQAYTILGVAVGGDYEVGFGQKCLAGLLNLINEKLTLGLVPVSTICDILIEYIFPWFGLDTDSLNAARDSAAAELEAWNIANPDQTYDNLQDYNNKDKWYTKVGNAVSNAWDATKTGVSNGISAIGSAASNAWDATKTGVSNGISYVSSTVSNAKDMVSTAFNNVSDKVTNTIDSVTDIAGFVKTVTTNVFKYATTEGYSWDIDDVLTEDDPLYGIKKSLYQVLKLPLGALGVISFAGKKIFDTISSYVSKVKDGTSDAFSDIVSVSRGEYTVFNKDYWAMNNDDDNPFGIISQISSLVVKAYGAGPAMIGYAGTKIKDGFIAMVNGAKEGAIDASSDVLSVMKGEYTIYSKNYWTSDNNDEDNPISKLGSVYGFVYRMMSAPTAMLGWTGTKIKDGFIAMVNGAKEGAIDASSDIASVTRGEYTVFNKDYWSSDNSDDDNPISKIGSVYGFVYRMMSAPAAMIGYAGTKVSNFFKNIIADVNEGSLSADTDISDVINGEYTIFNKDYWTNDDEDPDNPLSIVGTVSGFIDRLFHAPIAMVGYVGTKVSNFFASMVDDVKDAQIDTDKIIANAEAGNISVFSSDYWKSVDNSGSPLGIFNNIISYIERLTNAPIVLLKGTISKIKEKFTGIKSWFGGLFGDSDDLEEYSDFSGSGSSRKKKSKYGLGHAYQSDDVLSNMKYGDSTIGEAGCAPVAATNLLNNLNRDVSVTDAASYAEKNNMTVPGGGTDMNYFNSYLGSHGISTSNTNSKSGVLEALGNGNQVVMLGQDSNNGDGVPFGTNPHFVTATGLDSMGNIIAEDPDLPEGSVTYNKNDILNSMITSVVAKTGSKRKRKSGRKRSNTNRLNRRTNAIKGMGRLYGLGTTMGADAIINVARSQIGVEETPTNNVKYNDAFYGYKNADGDSYKWCCVFVWWVFNQAGASALFNGGKKEAGCEKLKKYYTNNGQNVSYPEPGDIVFFNWDGGSTANHVGIVTEVNSATDIYTVEGNTGSTNYGNGGTVKESHRTGSCIIGYARPNYPYVYDASTIVDMSKYGDSSDYSSIATEGGTSSDASSTTSNLLTQFTDLGSTMVKKLFGEDAYNAFYGSTDGSDTENSSYVSTTNTADLSGNTDAEKIWNYLIDKGYTKSGTAGIMGNLYAESGLKTNNLQNTYNNSLNLTDDQYTSSVNTGNRTKNTFKNDSAGYGLAQWTYNTRKEGLYNATKDSGKDINDLGGQLDYLHKELGEYGLQDDLMKSSVYNDASDLVLEKFEKPAELNYETRRDYSKQMYDTYSGLGRGGHHKYTGGAARALNNKSSSYYGGASSTSSTSSTTENNKSMVDYQTFLETIVTILMNISDNTALLTKILEVLSNNFNIDIDTSDIDAATSSTKAQTQTALKDLVQRSSGNNTGISSLLNSKDTSYLISAMQAIAQE